MNAASAVKKFLAAMKSQRRTKASPKECWSCAGYGHLDEHGRPSIDRRDRKCMDCGGTGVSP